MSLRRKARVETPLVVMLAIMLASMLTPMLTGGTLGVSAQQGVPPAPADVTAAKAYSAIERSCAGCHQDGMLGGQRARGDLSNILALGEIATKPWLVRPGMPDASRIYNVALTRERHLDIFNDPAIPEPTASEVQAIRDWIADVPVGQNPACVSRKGLTPADLGELMASALANLEPETARLTRFVSLAHLEHACVSARELDELKVGLDKSPAWQAAGGTRNGAKPLTPIDTNRLVWRLSLPALGWQPEDWDRHIATYSPRGASGLNIPRQVAVATGTQVPLVAADWLAHVIDVETPAQALAQAGDRDAAPAGAAGIAQTWRRPGTIERLAADLWLPASEVSRRLSDIAPSISLAARRLAAGDGVSRHDLDAITGLMLGRPDAGQAANSERLDIALWSDKATYAVGETASFSVETSRDCYLTLVGVDRAGRGTVLYPSEFEPANWIARGQVLRVPANNAAYRFRFKEKGRETIVAICSATHKSPPGIAHDYDRLRFTVLGDWQLFLREPPEMKDARRDDAATDVPRPEVRQRRRGRNRAAEPKAIPLLPEADIQTRTAISISIE